MQIKYDTVKTYYHYGLILSYGIQDLNPNCNLRGPMEPNQAK